MGFLNRALQNELRTALAPLKWPVTLVVFTRRAAAGAEPCESCDDTRGLIEEVASASDGKVSVEARDLDRDADLARFYRVDKAPAVVVLGGGSGRKDFGIRFYGLPGGYEFGTLVEDIRLAGGAGADLSERTVAALSRLGAPMHIQVFVTPTCPYCPRSVLLAHKLAMASDLVTADAVNAMDFPELANRYQVYGVPRTVVNETIHIEGAVPESALLSELKPLLAG